MQCWQFSSPPCICNHVQDDVNPITVMLRDTCSILGVGCVWQQTGDICNGVVLTGIGAEVSVLGSISLTVWRMAPTVLAAAGLFQNGRHESGIAFVPHELLGYLKVSSIMVTASCESSKVRLIPGWNPSKQGRRRGKVAPETSWLILPMQY